MATKLLRSRRRRWQIAKALARILPLTWRRQLLYLKHYGRPANLVKPTRFSEKMQWRIIHDRSPMLTVACDKLRTYEHARAMADAAGLKLRIPHVYSFSANVDAFISELQQLYEERMLPTRFVVKPNHGSGQVLVVDGRPDWVGIKEQVGSWITDAEYDGLRWVWGYSQARRGLVAEGYIGGVQEPLEWQVWMFNGEPAAYLLKQRDETGFSRANFDSEWRRLPSWNNTDREWLNVAVPPFNAAEVDLIAKVLSDGWSHLRVDLYVDPQGEIWIGELTAYSQEGLFRVSNEADDIDKQFGGLWRLP